MVVPAPGPARQLGGRRERGPGRRRGLAGLPGAPPPDRGSRGDHRGGPVHGRAAVRDGVRGAPRHLRRRVLRAPVVLRRPDGGWRLYLSCATPGSKHWWVEALDADTPADLPRGERTVVLPGDARVAVKDPVVTVREGRWGDVAVRAPADRARSRDRMSTAYLTSTDGLRWTAWARSWRPPGLLGRPRRPRHDGAGARPADRAVRRPPDRRGQLARGHLGGPGRRAGGSSTPTRRRPCCAPRLRRRLRYARPSRCRTGRRGSTSSSRAPTGPTTGHRAGRLVGPAAVTAYRDRPACWARLANESPSRWVVCATARRTPRSAPRAGRRPPGAGRAGRCAAPG